MSIPEITPAEVVARRANGKPFTLLDVREGWEIDVASVPEVQHIPMGEIGQRMTEIDKTRDVAVLCRSGRRSLEVARLLQQNGYTVANVTGGILAWSRDVDPSIPTY